MSYLEKKNGQLYLQGGRLSDQEGDNLVSQSWVDASFTTTTHSIDPITQLGYGYLFWNDDGYGVHCATGFGGQEICIDPHTERIVAQQRDPDFDNDFGIFHNGNF